MSRSSTSSTVVVTDSDGQPQTVLTTTSANNLSDSIVDLTADPVESKSSREAWRARHKKQPGQGNASTSGSVSTRPKTRSQSTTEAALNASIEIIDVPDSPDDISPVRVRVTKTSKKRPQESLSNPAPPPSKPTTPEAVYKCPVCLDSNRELKARDIGLMAITCGHILCTECAKEVKSECPTCRKKFKKTQIHPLFI